MAWSVITDSVLQVGRPIRALTMRLLRDNITAVVNGDAGAPRVQRDALQPLLIDTSKIADRQVTEIKLATGIPERNWVMNLAAAADVNQSGTLVWAQRVASPGVSQGVTYGLTYSGSDLRAAGLLTSGGVVQLTAASALSGTYRALGNCGTTVEDKQTLFQRIA